MVAHGGQHTCKGAIPYQIEGMLSHLLRNPLYILPRSSYLLRESMQL